MQAASAPHWARDLSQSRLIRRKLSLTIRVEACLKPVIEVGQRDILRRERGVVADGDLVRLPGGAAIEARAHHCRRHRRGCGRRRVAAGAALLQFGDTGVVGLRDAGHRVGAGAAPAEPVALLAPQRDARVGRQPIGKAVVEARQGAVERGERGVAADRQFVGVARRAAIEARRRHGDRHGRRCRRGIDRDRPRHRSRFGLRARRHHDCDIAARRYEKEITGEFVVIGRALLMRRPHRGGHGLDVLAHFAHQVDDRFALDRHLGEELAHEHRGRLRVAVAQPVGGRLPDAGRIGDEGALGPARLLDQAAFDADRARRILGVRIIAACIDEEKLRAGARRAHALDDA